MNKWLAFFLMCMIVPALAKAAEIPPASDYDFTPEQVFSPQMAIQGAIPADPITAYPESVTFSIDQIKEGRLLPQHVDWESLIKMNSEASSIWSLMLSCSGNDEDLARKNYLANTLCPEAQTKLRHLRDELNNFLDSTMVDAFNQILQCYFRNRLHTPATCIFTDFISNPLNSPNWNFLGYNPTESIYGDYLRVLNLVPAPRFHFLLIQLLLEQVAAGYPLNYGGYICGTLELGCLARTLFNRSNRMVVASSEADDWNVPSFFKSEDQRSAIVGWVNQALTPNAAIPKLDPSLLSDPRLVLLRRGRIAARILNHMDLGPLKCSDWGLWPLASVDLVGILAQSRYDLAPPESNELPALAVRLGKGCERPIPHTLLGSGSYDGIPGDHWPYSRNPITAIQIVGGWRGLLSRYEK